MTGRTLEERVTDLESSMAVLAKLPGQFDAFRGDVLARFEQIDRRFEQVDARFEQIDARFEQIDAHLQQTDNRFTRLEQRITSESEHLYARMRMLHEELIDRMRIGREGPGGDEPKPPRGRRRSPKR